VIKAFPQHSAAQAAGLQLVDRIIAIDGAKTLFDAAMSGDARRAFLAAETVQVSVQRGAAQITVPVKLGKWSRTTARAIPAITG
jgi:regulator of sigma E protease